MYLKPNSTIAIAATARHIDLASINLATKIFESWGLKVVLSKYLFEQHHAFAGTDEQRADALQELINNDEINAIVIARGGYGTVRIIDKIDFTQFIKKPKIIAGFSDVTVLHAHINQNFGIKTLHSCMPITMQGNYFNELTIQSFKDALFGKTIHYQFAQHALNNCHPLEGELVGGNLSVLYSLLGSKSQLNLTNKILFIEDIGEYFYHIDRMMQGIDRAGMFKNLKGLLVGGMNDMNENAPPFAFNQSCYQIINDVISKYNIPVFYGFPAGHENLNLCVKLAANCKISFNQDHVFFEQGI